MDFFKTMERIRQLHGSIKCRHTGTPGELSKTLGVSRATLYNMLDELKSHRAPIAYSRAEETFYYTSFFELEISYKIQLVEDEGELKKIEGGTKLFRSVNLFRRNEAIFATESIDQLAYKN